VYCIPGHANRVLKIDESDALSLVGPELPGKFKWLRGVRVGDIIYGLPCHANTVLRIDTRDDTVSHLPIPYADFYHNPDEAKEQEDMTWKYHGGTTTPPDNDSATTTTTTTAIYCIPQSAWHVLKIQNDECSFVPSAPMLGRYKWYGGVLGRDGAIYGIPHNATSVLRIFQDAVSLHGDFGTGGHKWHGASTASDGTIVSVPANASTVLCIEPADPEPHLYELSSDCIQTGRHRTDGKYKYLGAMQGNDGCVYCFPSGAEHVLKINPGLQTVESIGTNLVNLERMVQNKWQNGLTQDKYVYAIPLSAETVLRIDTTNGDVTTWKLPLPNQGLAKWEGGLLRSNGVMYCMPNNHKAVLRICTKDGGSKKQTK